MAESGTYKGKEHWVYDSLEEFREAYPDESIVEDWRNAKEGDWVWTDDGCVVQILRRKVFENDHRQHPSYVRTVVGSFIQSDFYSMDADFENHPNPSQFSTTGVDAVNVEYLKHKSMTAKDRLTAYRWAQGVPLEQAYRETHKAENPTYIRKRVLGLARNEEFWKMAHKGFKRMAESVGMDLEWTVEKMKHYIDKDDELGYQALQDFLKIIGIQQEVKSQTNIMGYLQSEARFTADEIEGAKREELPANGRVDETTAEDETVEDAEEA